MALSTGSTAQARTFVWPLRVYYEDTDASGVVYHATYLRYLERARTEWLRNLGFSQQSLRDRLGVVFTVADLEAAFLKPARLDDELEATVSVEEARRASLRFRQTLRRREGDGALLMRAAVRVGCVDAATFRPRALPEEFLRLVVTPSSGVSV